MRVSAAFLMKNRGDAFGAPIAENFFHIGMAIRFAFDEIGIVANGFSLLVNLRDILMHIFRRDLHVANSVVLKGFGMRFPMTHRMGHQLAHGGLVVIIAHHTTGDA